MTMTLIAYHYQSSTSREFQFQTNGPPATRQKKSMGCILCSAAGMVRRQTDDDWQTVDAVERERQTLVCNSPPDTAELFPACHNTKLVFALDSCICKCSAVWRTENQRSNISVCCWQHEQQRWGHVATCPSSWCRGSDQHDIAVYGQWYQSLALAFQVPSPWSLAGAWPSYLKPWRPWTIGLVTSFLGLFGPKVLVNTIYTDESRRWLELREFWRNL